MANPILSRPDAFTPRAQTQYPQTQYPQNPYAQYPAQGYGQQPGQFGQAPMGQFPGGAPQGRQEPSMTLEDVITKTAICMFTLMASAVATFIVINPLSAGMALIVSGIVGFVTVLLVAGRKRIPVGGVLFYAVVEGIFIGAFSKMFEMQFDGIVQQAVLGTFAAAAATLGAYRFFNIRVTDKMRRVIFITTAAFAGVMLVNFVLSLMGVQTGLRGMGGLGFVAALLGAGLGVFNLIVDFDDIERGIASNAPASESWRAAFGLTVTMVWLYTEILRLLSFFRRD